jgi:hypothetical protein
MSAVTSRAVAQDLPLATGAQTTGGIVARIFVKLSHQDTKRDIVNYSLILYRANRDSTILTTEDGGRITMIVPAGDYQLVSVAPLAWSGGQYVWNVPLRVYAGMPALELNAGNAQAAPTPTFSRATPIFSRASPTTRNPLTGAVEPSDSAATPSLTAPAVICCMKDPAAAVLFSVIFPGGGQFYNGEAGKGVLFFVLEVGGIAGSELAAQDYNTCEDNIGSGCSGKQTLEYVGVGVAIGSWIYSLVDACAGAHRHNRNLGFEPRVAFMVVPGALGRTDIGLRVALR